MVKLRFINVLELNGFDKLKLFKKKFELRAL